MRDENAECRDALNKITEDHFHARIGNIVLLVIIVFNSWELMEMVYGFILTPMRWARTWYSRAYLSKGIAAGTFAGIAGALLPVAIFAGTIFVGIKWYAWLEEKKKNKWALLTLIPVGIAMLGNRWIGQYISINLLSLAYVIDLIISAIIW